MPSPEGARTAGELNLKFSCFMCFLRRLRRRLAAQADDTDIVCDAGASAAAGVCVKYAAMTCSLGHASHHARSASARVGSRAGSALAALAPSRALQAINMSKSMENGLEPAGFEGASGIVSCRLGLFWLCSAGLYIGQV